MKRESTPPSISEQIVELCKEVSPDQDPVYIDVYPDNESRMLECFNNVSNRVSISGGRQVNGWVVWQWANMMIEVEAHSIWEDPRGNRIDITPHEPVVDRILFIEDSKLVYRNENIRSIRKPLTNSPLVAELIDISETIEDVMCSYTPGCGIPLPELQARLWPYKRRRDEILNQLNRKVERNDPCPCQSGLKYKFCCGR